MSAEEDDIPYEDDDWEPSPEEVAAAERHAQLCKRFPIATLLWKVFERHRRLARLKRLDAPVLILNRQRDLLDQVIEELMSSFPYDEVEKYTPLMAVIGTLQNEVGTDNPHPVELDS